VVSSCCGAAWRDGWADAGRRVSLVVVTGGAGCRRLGRTSTVMQEAECVLEHVHPSPGEVRRIQRELLGHERDRARATAGGSSVRNAPAAWRVNWVTAGHGGAGLLVFVRERDMVSAMNGAVMRIFIAGASGAIGSHLVTQLVARGHEVVGTTRSADKMGALRALGAEPVVVDVLDPDSVADVVAKAEPEVIVHQLSALSGASTMREMKRMAAATNRLRTEGTDHLLAAARAVGVRRFVAQSNSLWMERTGGPVADESGRLEPNPPPDAEPAVAALRHVEAAVTGITWADGIVLRYGSFYGPGTGLSVRPDGITTEQIRKRKFPIIGDGGGVWSLVHITDAASATVAAVERGNSGIYHVADDDPAPVRVWLPYLARTLGAEPPRRVPAWLARPLAGQGAVDMMTRARGISCDETRRELAWTPQYRSWRTGFTDGLS
ncbi:NAD(P)-dependent oxidoreductase, partial [Nonomuraea sp. RK-328]|nr:NAD(P)-dependent oxidoreductase [Nonomuraea sp. RK-328]